MDEHDRSLPGSVPAEDQPTEPPTDERPLFATTDDIDPEVASSEESKEDLAFRGVAVSGALGGNAGTAAGALAGHGAALGVNAEAGEPVEVEGRDRVDRAPGG